MDYENDSKTIFNSMYSNVCRCCLKEDGLLDISTEYINSEITYEAMLKNTFNIKLSQLHDTNTRLICDSCIDSLQNAFAFKRMINSSEQTILEYLLRLEFGNDINVEVMKVKVEGIGLDKSTNDAIEIHDQNDNNSDDNINVQKVKVEPAKLDESMNDASVIDDNGSDDQLLSNLKLQLELEPEDATIFNPRKRKRSLKSKTKESKTKKCKTKKQNNDKAPKNPQKDWSKIKEHRGEGPLLRENSLKLIENSTLCVFQWNKSWYRCFCCKESFQTIEELKEHTTKSHTLNDIEKKMINQHNKHVKVEISNLNCKLCREKLENITTLKYHLSRTHSIDISDDLLIPFKVGEEWKCQLCFENFEGFRLLNMHMNKHYPKQICHICGRSFSHLIFLNLHKTRFHRNNECKTCNLTFDNKLDKKEHDISVHDAKFERKSRFPCPHCSERFFQEDLRVRHMIENHGKAKPDFRCGVCSKTFLTRSLINNHIKNVHNKEKNKECDVCHNFFYTKSDLERHMVTHTGEKKFSCDICNNLFATRDSLRRHIKRTHVSIN